jgi:hypothetical protein
MNRVLLDHLIADEATRLASVHDHVCGCPSCRAEASPARRATRGGSGGRALPAWKGWSTPVTLAQIQQAQKDVRAGKSVALRLRPFLSTGNPHIYRITRAGIDRDRPLTIGMTQDTRSIAQRVGEHRGSARGDPQVRQAIGKLGPGQILIQAGQLRGHPDIRQTPGYEIWLQGRERPRIYEPDTRTFEAQER